MNNWIQNIKGQLTELATEVLHEATEEGQVSTSSELQVNKSIHSIILNSKMIRRLKRSDQLNRSDFFLRKKHNGKHWKRNYKNWKSSCTVQTSKMMQSKRSLCAWFRIVING